MMDGSIGESAFPYQVIPNVIESKTCLKPMVNSWAESMISLYIHYQSGHLAVDGGILNQPYAYLRAMEIVKAWHKMEQ